jgi:hypothetical protein
MVLRLKSHLSFVTNGTTIQCLNTATKTALQWNGQPEDYIPTKAQLPTVLKTLKADKLATDVMRWLRLFGQVFRVFKWKHCSASRRRGCGNVKIGFIDFQGLVGRTENSSIVFRAFHETGISTACFIAR